MSSCKSIQITPTHVHECVFAERILQYELIIKAWKAFLIRSCPPISPHKSAIKATEGKKAELPHFVLHVIDLPTALKYKKRLYVSKPERQEFNH